MSLHAEQLRQRKPVRMTPIKEKIGSHQRDMEYYHDTATYAIVGISLLAAFTSLAQYVVPILYFSDVVWLEYGDKHCNTSQIPKLYKASLICTALLAMATHYPELRAPFQIHMLVATVPVFSVAHRQQKDNKVLELFFVIAWLVMKIGMTWMATFQYLNVAGEAYSKWVTVVTYSPLMNPWTNPPVILVMMIACISSVIDLGQSFWVMSSNHKLI
tara:strand:+ start:250 stop:894 length:645 start_codon:yes stop_codon:yes gene_type:complete